MRSSSAWVWLGLGVLPMFASCEQAPPMPDQCNIRLAIVSPHPATLMVGQEVALEAELSPSPGCLPADAEPGSLRWTSDDTGIATVDATSGRVKAIRAGTAQVSLTTAMTHTLLTTSRIQVIP
jgi:hypothetical protein